MPLKCIVCKSELEGFDSPNQPHAGIAFSSPGHYGTTVFDPMDGSYLEINVCDPCIVESGRSGEVLRYRANAGNSEAIYWKKDE